MKQLNNSLIFGINYGGSVWRGKEGSLYAEYPTKGRLSKVIIYHDYYNHYYDQTELSYNENTGKLIDSIYNKSDLNTNKSANVPVNVQKKEPSAYGTYSYSDNSVELTIVVSGESWKGKTMLKTGFGSGNDNQNAKYSSGVVKGNGLYDSNGMVKIGSIEGTELHTSIGGQSVTLSKK